MSMMLAEATKKYLDRAHLDEPLFKEVREWTDLVNWLEDIRTGVLIVIPREVQSTDEYNQLEGATGSRGGDGDNSDVL